MVTNFQSSVLAIGIVLSVGAAPAAQAQPRDTGVGRILALQGNQALQVIKAELRETIKALAPVLPSRPAVKTAPKPVALAPVNGVANRSFSITPAAVPSTSAGDNRSFSMTPAAVPSTSAGDNRSFSMTPAAVRCAE